MNPALIRRNQCARKVLELFPQFEIDYFDARQSCGESPFQSSEFHAKAGEAATAVQACDAFARLFLDEAPKFKNSTDSEEDYNFSASAIAEASFFGGIMSVFEI